MTRRLRVLVFPCGGENALEIHDSLRHSVHVDLFGASSADDHGRFRFRHYTGGLPRIEEPGFGAAFAALVTDLAIDLVFASHDSVAEHLAQLALPAGCRLVNGDADTARVTRRKTATYDALAGLAGLPRRYAGPEDVTDWPVIVKPDRGQGGQHVVMAADAEALRQAIADVPEPVIVEYLPGAEATVDCFTDRHGRLVYAGARSRERVRAGISMRSRYLDDDAGIAAMAAGINHRLRLRGPWFFQVRQDRHGQWTLLEVSCRAAGTMAASRARGVNLPLLAVHDAMGRDVVAAPDRRVRLVDRSIATCAELDYTFDTVFVDLDDTLVAAGRAVVPVLAFLFQAVGEGRRVVLITRHEHDIAETLRLARISAGLFDRIVHITDGRPKTDWMAGACLLIDNHFPERRQAAARGFLALDVDAVQFLLR